MTARLNPYPAYKDSGVPWLGDVPAHWEVRRLKQSFDRILGGSTPSSNEPLYWGGNIVWVTPVDVSRWPRLRDSIRHLTREGLSACSTELVPPGSIIVTSRAPVGNVAIADVELCTNQGCKALVTDGYPINPEYALLLFQIMARELQSVAVGTTFAEISTSRLGDIRIPVPPLSAQHTIARYLNHMDSRINRLIRIKRKLITLLEEQKQAIIHHAVIRGLDPDVELRPSGVEWLGDIPAHWEEHPAKYYFREVDKRSETGKEELLSVSHITGVTPRSQKNITMFKALSYSGHKLCEQGDLVINTMWAWMGALGVAKQDGLVSPSYAVYRPIEHDLYLPEFVDNLLRAKPYISEYVCLSTGIRSSRLRLYPEKFLAIPIIRPSVEEQLRIVEAIERETEQFNHAIANTNAQINLIREYRARLIADVVTGKLDVRAAAAALPEDIDPDEVDDLLEDEEELEDELEEETADDSD